MRVFIAGVMQGSRTDERVTDQGYRQFITRVLREHLNEADIIDPWALHPDSENYDARQSHATFMRMNELAGQADVLVAFVPEATMGTAIEMWEAYRARARVFTISPMVDNWVVKLLSTRVFPSLGAFEAYVVSGSLASEE